MAIVTGQTIPAESDSAYHFACHRAATWKGISYVRRRVPLRLPNMQGLFGKGIHAAQAIQRARFRTVVDGYHRLTPEARARWKEESPEWKSILFWYNYFILEGLMGGGHPKRPQMIKSIQTVKEEVPTTGTKTFTIEAVDPDKCVVMLQGNSYISDKVQRLDGTMADNVEIELPLSPSVDPDIAEVVVRGGGGYMDISAGEGSGRWGDIFCSYLSTTVVKLTLVNLDTPYTFGYSVEIIEHKAQTVHPVLISVSATSVVIDWALVPSVAADVSITVVEYI